ncbi:hypothetical protein D3C76_52990 [compost metagenome]
MSSLRTVELAEEVLKSKGWASAIQILEGAVPACVFEDGQVIPIELDATLLSRLNDTFEEHQYMLSLVNPGMTLRPNPYE